MAYEEKCDYISKRFPEAKFAVCCFNTIEEVDTKVLTSADTILYTDLYTVTVLSKNGKRWRKKEEYRDYFIVKKKPAKNTLGIVM